jgi:hypothetical protein
MLCDHAVGNCCILITITAQFLAAALQRQAIIDEKLYFEVFADARTNPTSKPRAPTGR